MGSFQALLYGGYEYVITSLDEMLATLDDSRIGYFIYVDLESTDTL